MATSRRQGHSAEWAPDGASVKTAGVKDQVACTAASDQPIGEAAAGSVRLPATTIGNCGLVSGEAAAVVRLGVTCQNANTFMEWQVTVVIDRAKLIRDLPPRICPFSREQVSYGLLAIVVAQRVIRLASPTKNPECAVAWRL